MGILRAAPDLASRLTVRRAATDLGPVRARRLLEALIVGSVPLPPTVGSGPLPPTVESGPNASGLLLVPSPVGALAAAACGLAAREGDALAPDAATALATALAAGATMGALLGHLQRHRDDVTAAARACWTRDPDVLAPGHGPGAHVPRAVGVARAMRLGARPTCVLILLPADLAREPDLHNGLNFAAVARAPVVFVTTPGRSGIRAGGAGSSTEPASGGSSDRSEASPSPGEGGGRPGMAAVAISYGIPAERVAASAPLVVWAAIDEAADHARGGEGPALVELVEDRGPPVTLDRLLADLAAAAGCAAPEQASLRRRAETAWRAARSNPRAS